MTQSTCCKLALANPHVRGDHMSKHQETHFHTTKLSRKNYKATHGKLAGSTGVHKSGSGRIAIVGRQHGCGDTHRTGNQKAPGTKRKPKEATFPTREHIPEHRQTHFHKGLANEERSAQRNCCSICCSMDISQCQQSPKNGNDVDARKSNPLRTCSRNVTHKEPGE